VGFVIAVLGRGRLFIENTIAVVIPVIFSLRNLGRLARMWGIALGANLVGTLIAASFCSLAPVIGAELHAWSTVGSRCSFEAFRPNSWWAAMVWLIPSAATAEFHVTVLDDLPYLGR
jgi:formate-nitrite transporter family protein